MTNEPTEEQQASGSDRIVFEEEIVIHEEIRDIPAPEQPGKEERTKKEKQRDRTRGSYEALQQNLVTRLYHLQTEAQQVCESYLGNLDSDITTLTDFLDGSSEVRKSRDAKGKTLEAWDRILDGLKLKTSKGRRKDLRKIDQAIRAMMESAFE